MRITELILEEAVVDDMYEIIPSSVVMWMQVDGTEEMSVDFNMSVDNEGFPNSITLLMNMGSYNVNATYVGSNLDYTMKVTFRESNNTLLGIDMDIRYLANRDDVDRLSGHVDLGLIRFDG